MKENATSLKKRLIAAVLAMVMLVSALAGTTFAWFTDSVTSAGNKIQTGTLRADLLHKVEDKWVSLKENPEHKVFNYDKWEPGYTLVEQLKVTNNGTLALKYRLSVEVAKNTAILGENGENLADVIDVYVLYGESDAADFAAITADGSKWVHKGTLAQAMAKPAEFMGGELTAGAAAPLAIALHMQESAGNAYQELSVGDIYVNLIATQMSSESDSFGPDYDEGATFPEMRDFDTVIEVNAANGVVTEAVTKDNVTVPAGVKLQNGTTSLGASVKEKNTSDTNLTLGEGEIMRPVDVHVEGVAPDNTVAIIIDLGEVMPKGLNIGNYTLYHVENGQNVPMTAVAAKADLDAHNEFYYDPATGEVTVAMATFSEVAMIADTENAWEGELDYTWYDASKTELTIANADQLAAFGAIVGGMKKVTGRVDGKYTYSEEVIQDSFEGKTVKLIADINLGDKESENNSNIIFYPIGYWNNEGTYERKPLEERTTAVSSGFYTFEGTFDGNGHTVENFYHNTWEMKGDHNWYDTVKEQYFRDGMGLFGRVYKGTVKNLTVKNFSSDGEITTTGVIAAYADGATFENIAIFNCNPRVYNIGNGGIVGCVGWYAKEKNLKTTFKNITVDNSNKISALWGSYDVACGGVVGQYYPTSGQSSANYPVNAGISFENCHVSAIMDVYNDVCANYQYYAYRYTGMLIGSVRENETIDGKSYPKMDGITAKDCTVHFGDWNDYYYCEIIDNTTASYTHDYQMSRLTEIKAIDGTTITYLDGTTGTVPASGRANYVIVDYTKGHGTENATCYHFKDGKVWNHEDAGYHDGTDGGKIIDENGDGTPDLREDKQHIYLEFNNLVTGYGWGVTSRGFANLEGVTNLDIAQGEYEESVEKFYGKVEKIYDYTTYTFSEIFGSKVSGIKIVSSALAVGITNLGENNPVSATIVYDRENWENGTITFKGEGAITITIQDYFFCIPTTITVNIVAHDHAYDNACDTTCNTCGEVRGITHNYTPAVTAPTCTEAGYTTYTCACGDVYIADNTDALGHSYNTKVTDPTCTTGGYTTYTCSVCSHSYTADETAATGHSYNVVVTAPTCTEKGYTTYTCTCGDTYTADEVAATGHSYNAVVTAPTCTEKGYTTYTCACGDTYTADEVAATGHSYNAVKTTPTCTEKGYTTYTCSCGDTYTGDEVAALGRITTNFTGEFRYRVGNQNAVELSSLFNVEKHTVTVSGTNVAGNASVTVNGTSLQFNGTGVVKVTLTSDCTCGECALELTLEVVDAVNATGATNATSNNVVLLNDAGFSSLEVSGGYTLYGNGFTLTCGSDSAALDMGYSFVTLNNGTLDNVQIVCPNFDYAVLYKSNLDDMPDDRKQTTDRTRYYNVKSGVMVSGNSQILNSRISGARAAVNVSGGNCVIDNSRIELGAVASLLVGAANSLTLRDVTLVQKSTASTHDSNKKLMGFSVLYMCDSEGKATPTTLEGTLIQYAWVNEGDKQYVPSNAQDIVDGVMKEKDFIHNINGNDSLNLGFAYMPEDASGSVGAPDNITDNRTDKATIPYEMKDVKITIVILSTTVYVYSYKNTNGTADSFKTVAKYEPNKYSDIITVTYSDAKDGLESSKSYGTDGWVYELNVDLDKASGYKLDFSKLSMSVNGATVTDFKVDGSAKPASPVAVTAGGKTYILTATVDGKVYTATYKVTGTETSKESPSKISGPATAGFGVAKSYGGDWSGAAEVLTGVKVKYWSVAENKYVEFDFSNFTVPGNAGKLNGANNYWEYTHTNNDFTLKVTNTVAIHSGKSVYGMPIRGTDGKLYFTISSTNGYVGSGTTSRAITMQYEFTDNNGGEKLTFTHTFNISYSKDAQYSYSDLSSSGKLTKLEASSGGNSPCVTPDTLITLADGTQKRIDEVTYADQLLVWNHFTGKYDVAPAAIIFNHGYDNNTIIKLSFSDGTVVKVANLHQFYDIDLNRYVSIDADSVAQYVGHRFAKQSGDGFTTVTLDSYDVSVEYEAAYGIISAFHYNIIVEGMISTDFMPEDYDLFNYFELGENMTFDEAQMQADIEKYGLYSYEDFADYLTYEQFVGFNVQYFKIAVGKGYYTYEGILDLIDTYLNV